MKAAVFYGPSGSWPQKPMVVEDVSDPRPDRDEVLIRIAGCGLCHTDLEYLKESPPMKAFPIILGHEPSGIVQEVGSDVKNVKAGERVLVAFSITCGTCQFCRSGQENLCPNSAVVGASRDGAFAEYVVVPSKAVYHLPDSLPLAESCIISDAVATSHHAVYETANVKPGDTVAIFGASGGLGLICTQLASGIGANVIAVGRKRWKLEKAKEFGAKEIVSVEEVREVDKAIRRLTGGGADISIDVTGVPAMVESAFRSTRLGGTVVVVGLSFRKVQFEINRLVWLQLNVKGSRTYNPYNLPKVLKLVESGVVNLDKLISHRFKLDDINEAYLTLDRGEMLRGIITP